MSAIETYLQYIASKVLARDVRTAIVNAIRQCYDDVHNPTLNTEAIQAAVQAKIDAGQMAGLTIGDGTLTGAKFADGTIPKSKLDPSITFDADAALDNTSTNAIQNKVVAGAISEINESLESLGLTDDIKAALLACFENVAWKGDSAPFYIERLRTALYGESEPEKFFTNGLGLTVSNNVPTVSTNTKRGLLYQKEGTTPLLSSVQGVNNVYPIHIPQGATGVKFHGMQTSDYISINLQILAYINGSWKIMNSAGFSKIVPDILSRTEIANYNNGNYYMIGIYGISDATHTSPLDGTVTVDTSDFTMEVVAE